MNQPAKALPIQLMLVEDQLLVRKGLIGLLALIDGITVVAEAADGEEAFALIQQTMPDVLLLDVRMPKVNGIELLCRLKALGCQPPTILLTTFDDDEAFRQGTKEGAKGFLMKDISVERLEAAIRTVAAGGSVIRPALTDRITREIRKQRHEAEDTLPVIGQLTRRELEILQLMAGGYSNREIAELITISEGVVKNHSSSIFSKLAVRDRTRAVLKAIELGYL